MHTRHVAAGTDAQAAGPAAPCSAAGADDVAHWLVCVADACRELRVRGHVMVLAPAELLPQLRPAGEGGSAAAAADALDVCVSPAPLSLCQALQAHASAAADALLVVDACVRLAPNFRLASLPARGAVLRADVLPITQLLLHAAPGVAARVALQPAATASAATADACPRLQLANGAGGAAAAGGGEPLSSSDYWAVPVLHVQRESLQQLCAEPCTPGGGNGGAHTPGLAWLARALLARGGTRGVRAAAAWAVHTEAGRAFACALERHLLLAPAAADADAGRPLPEGTHPAAALSDAALQARVQRFLLAHAAGAARGVDLAASPASALPERFADARSFRHAVKAQHPLFRTSNADYGCKPPTMQAMPLVWKGLKAGLSRDWPGNYADSGLRTAPRRNRVHDELDWY